MVRVDRSPVRAALSTTLLIGLLALTTLLVACQQTDEPAADLEPVEETNPVLKVYNRDTYIDPEILTSFEENYDVDINLAATQIYQQAWNEILEEHDS